VIDWNGLNLHFSITDVVNGAIQTFGSFLPFIELFLGLCLAIFAIGGLLSIFRGGSFWDAWRKE